MEMNSLGLISILHNEIWYVTYFAAHKHTSKSIVKSFMNEFNLKTNNNKDKKNEKPTIKHVDL